MGVGHLYGVAGGGRSSQGWNPGQARRPAWRKLAAADDGRRERKFAARSFDIRSGPLTAPSRKPQRAGHDFSRSERKFPEAEAYPRLTQQGGDICEAIGDGALQRGSSGVGTEAGVGAAR